jgi:hypothetical protein
MGSDHPLESGAVLKGDHLGAMRNLHRRCVVVPIGRDDLDPQSLSRDRKLLSELPRAQQEKRPHLVSGVLRLPFATHLILAVFISR